MPTLLRGHFNYREVCYKVDLCYTKENVPTYGLEVSDSTVSRITDKILPVVKEWQQRPLAEIYAVVLTLFTAVKGHIVKRAVYPKIEIAQSWEANWPKVSTYFNYPQEVRYREAVPSRGRRQCRPRFGA